MKRILLIVLPFVALAGCSTGPRIAGASDTKGARYLEDRGDYYYDQRDWRSAIGYYTDALGRSPEGFTAGSVRVGRGLAYIQLGYYDDAIEDFKRARRDDPGNPLPLAALEVTYLKLGKPDAAVDVFTEAMKSDPRNWFLYNERGRIYESLGRHEEAQADFAESRRLSSAEKKSSQSP